MEKPSDTAELTDGDLLRLASGGNEAAFLELYSRHKGPVYRFALHMSGRKEVAEEVIQDVFLTVLTDARRYSEERGDLQAYLLGTARHKLRKALAVQRRSSGDLEDALRVESESGDLLQNMERAQGLRLLQAAVLSLPPRYREVVVLCDLEEMDYSQVARHLDCALGTVRSRLHRARALLSKKLVRSERCPA